LRDKAEQYGNRLINSGVRITVRRLPPTPLHAPDARNQCARQVHALGEIASLIAGPDGPPPPPT
jgi:hypothetical protein